MKKELFLEERLEMAKDLQKAKEYIKLKASESKDEEVVCMKNRILNDIVILENINMAILLNEKIIDIRVENGSLKESKRIKLPGLIFNNKRVKELLRKEIILYKKIEIFDYMVG